MLKVIKILSIGFLLAFASSIWIGCSEEPNVADPPDPVEMTVTVWPEDSATNVARDVKPTFTFSHEVNNDLPDITVTIQGSGQEIALTVVMVSSTVYRIEFTNLLDELATYDMYLHNAKGKNGEVLSGLLPIVSSFTTQEIILPSLILSVIFPPNNSEIPDSTSTLHYQANFELNSSTVEPSFTLMNTTTSTQLNPIINVNGKDIYVNVDGLLEHSSAYTAEFDPEIIRGANGEKPSTIYTFMFTTAAVYVQQPFTTPEGFLQIAGDFYEGKYYVGGQGPDDEGFVASYNWEGDSLWFNNFRINELSTYISRIAVNSTGIYSIAFVNQNGITAEVWLYRQSFTGEFVNMWKLSDAGQAYAICSSENDIYVVWSHNHINEQYLSRYTISGLQSTITMPTISSVIYSDGYLYVSGASSVNTKYFVSKWHTNLSDSLWYREVAHQGVFTVSRAYLTNVSGQIWCLGLEYDQQSAKRILLRYDTNGSLLADLVLPFIDGNFIGVCSDDIYGYMAGNDGLVRVDLNANISHLSYIDARDVFRSDDPNGSNHKIAVTDKTNKLKFYNR